MKRSALWLKCGSSDVPPQVRLFCLPHAGGGARAFHSWNAALPASVEVCPVLLPGRESRLSESLYIQMEPLVSVMAQELRPWLDVPYVVFGHSMGALLAFEWVRRIQREGHPMPAWLFLCGRRAPDMPGDTNLLHSLTDCEFVKELCRRYNGIPDELLRDAEFMEGVLPILRADIATVESYRFQEGEPLNCPITAFAGSQDKSVNWDQLVAWKRQTSQRFAMHILPGGHFFPQLSMLQAISSTLTELQL